jgi:hypothetical protein
MKVAEVSARDSEVGDRKRRTLYLENINNLLFTTL